MTLSMLQYLNIILCQKNDTAVGLQYEVCCVKKLLENLLETLLRKKTGYLGRVRHYPVDRLLLKLRIKPLCLHTRKTDKLIHASNLGVLLC